MTNDEQLPFATTAAVAGLAREVEALQRTIRSLNHVPGQLDDLADVVARLSEDAAAHHTPTTTQTPSWLALTALDDGEALLTDLIEWMNTIYLRYPDASRTLPNCWLWHPEVIEELVWLQAAWRAAYTHPEGTISAAADWHDRQRPGVVRRIKDQAGLCSIENHQPGHDRQPAIQAPLVSAARVIVRWWTTDRTAAGPEPTHEQLAEAAAQHRHSNRRGRP